MKAFLARSRPGVTIEQSRVQVGEVPIYTYIAGQGTPIVLVHGLSGSWRWWARNIPALAAIFRVYAIDLIGFGASRSKQHFVLGDAARYLAQWMDQLSIERASLVGHSMGGLIAADLAVEFPDRVDKLVLVDAAALPLGQRYLRHTIGLLQQMPRLPISFWPVLFADGLRAGPATLWSAASQLLGTDFRPKLGHIQAPTLVIWGEHDTLVPLDLGRRLSQQLSKHDLVVIKQASHNPMWDQPEIFNRVLIDFLLGPALPTADPNIAASEPPCYNMPKLSDE